MEIDSSKIKAITEMPSAGPKKEHSGFLSRINYIGLFIAKLTTTCEPLFKLLKENAPMVWTNDCQTTFEKIKTYLLNSHGLVPPKLKHPLLMYLAVHKTCMGCMLKQHDESGKKKQTIYYLRTDFESLYSR